MKIFKQLSISVAFLFITSFQIFAEEIGISAKSAILICADSGSVLWSKNETEPLPMASTTKIMTSLLALENMEACGKKEIEITDEMVRVEGTSMGLMPGDIVNLQSLAQGMLLCSGNDAANAAAISVGGTTDKFISIMNEKAKQIGMQDTKFSTPSGLEKDNHHSTAKDMAILGAYAMENENFSSIVSKKSMPVKFINPSKTVNYRNHNKLLRLYSDCIGIKTGFTKAAGRCLVSCAEKNGVRLVCVTLNAPSDWDDHIKLYNFGFENTVSKCFSDRNLNFTVLSEILEQTGHVEASCDSEFSCSFKKGDESKVERKIELPEKIISPVEKGQIIGNVVYYLDNKEIGKNEIISRTEVKKVVKQKRGFFHALTNFFRKCLGGN